MDGQTYGLTDVKKDGQSGWEKRRPGREWSQIGSNKVKQGQMGSGGSKRYKWGKWGQIDRDKQGQMGTNKEKRGQMKRNGQTMMIFYC